MVVPALHPDVAVVHVQRADASGNALMGITASAGSRICRQTRDPDGGRDRR